MAKKEMHEIVNRVQKRIQRQLSEFRFIARRDEIENEFQQSEKIRADKFRYFRIVFAKIG